MFGDEGLDSVELFLEAGGEIVGAVFEEDNEAEGEENEQSDPEKPAQERHLGSLTEALLSVNWPAAAKLRIDRPRGTDKLIDDASSAFGLERAIPRPLEGS